MTGNLTLDVQAVVAQSQENTDRIEVLELDLGQIEDRLSALLPLLERITGGHHGIDSTRSGAPAGGERTTCR